MYVKTIVSPLWKSRWPGGEAGLARDLARAVERGVRHAKGRQTIAWFRADDVAIPGRRNKAMFDAFRAHGAPLSPALVPAWVSADRWAGLLEQAGGDSPLWAWHQHGYKHANHEPPGSRKCEFGDSVPYAAALAALQKGKAKLERVCGASFRPLFTPPWNRTSEHALAALAEAGFRAVSRYVLARPRCPEALPDFPVFVDLHTRPDPDRAADRTRILREISTGLALGQCGIMLHHQRMNGRAEEFLHALLAALVAAPGVGLTHLGGLTELRAAGRLVPLWCAPCPATARA